jgi:hypothetical protein
MELQEIYESNGYPAIDKFFKIVKQQKLNFTRDDIKQFLDKQQVAQLHKKKVKRVKGTPITTTGMNMEWQIDLLDMSKFYHENQGMRWILIVVDIFTRRAYAEAIKNKETKNVLDGLQKIFKEAKVFPQVIASDNGSEWKNDVAAALKKAGIFHKTNDVGDHNVLGIIDRFSQTLKHMIYKHFTQKQTSSWTDILQKYISSYNKAEHSSLGMSPLEAEERPIDVANIHLNRAKEAKGKLKDSNIKVGDIVRIHKGKDTKFEKGYEIRWSLETYKVNEKKGKQFYLDNGKSYRSNKLQKVLEPIVVAKEPKKKNVAKTAKADYKQEVVLKREDIKQSNVRPKRTVRNNIPANILEEGQVFY